MWVGENIGRHINGNTRKCKKKEEPAQFDRKEMVSNADLTSKRQEKTELCLFVGDG